MPHTALMQLIVRGSVIPENQWNELTAQELNQQDSYGQTVLMKLFIYPSPDNYALACRLISRGADIFLVDGADKSAMHYFYLNRDTYVPANYQIPNAMLEHPQALSRFAFYFPYVESSPQSAAEEALLKYFLLIGGFKLIRDTKDIIRNHEEPTVLMNAAVSGAPVPFFQRYFSSENINQQNEDGAGALMLAFAHEHFDLAYYLLSRGAKTNMIDHQGCTTFDYFIRHGLNSQHHLIAGIFNFFNRQLSQQMTPPRTCQEYSRQAHPSYRQARARVGVESQVFPTSFGALHMDDAILLSLEMRQDAAIRELEIDSRYMYFSEENENFSRSQVSIRVPLKGPLELRHVLEHVRGFMLRYQNVIDNYNGLNYFLSAYTDEVLNFNFMGQANPSHTLVPLLNAGAVRIYRYTRPANSFIALGPVQRFGTVEMNEAKLDKIKAALGDKEIFFKDYLISINNIDEYIKQKSWEDPIALVIMTDPITLPTKKHMSLSQFKIYNFNKDVWMDPTTSLPVPAEYNPIAQRDKKLSDEIEAFLSHLEKELALNQENQAIAQFN